MGLWKLEQKLVKFNYLLVISTNTQKIRVLQKHFKKGEISRSEEQIAFWCPSCGDSDLAKRKLVVRLSDGWYHCWVCGVSGKSYHSLFRKLGPGLLNDPEVTVLFNAHASQDLLVKEEVNTPVVELPKELYLLGAEDVKDPDISCVRKYLKNRGVSRTDMLRWRICAVKEGNLKRKAIIPSFDPSGDLNYFVARTIDESRFKYTNAKRHRTEIIFNEIDIDWKQPITLVEGVFDAIKCPENTIPVLGSSLPKESHLFNMLWKNECRVTVAFDPDLKEKSHRVCETLTKAGLEVLQVWAPDGRDFGDMSKKEVSEVLKSAKPWFKESKIFFKIRNISSGSII